jgi:pimeloyl-ACP methyl ester carboxylesterase
VRAGPEYLEHLRCARGAEARPAAVGCPQRDLNATLVPTVAFGGSYGGMLASWLRIKYPSAVDGAIAASAPIWSFKGAVSGCPGPARPVQLLEAALH